MSNVLLLAGSTRKLYEKKLEVAMGATPVKTTSDKTYYREEGRLLWLDVNIGWQFMT